MSQSNSDNSYEINWSELYKIGISGSNASYPKLIGHDDEHFYVIRFQKKSSTIEKYKLKTAELVVKFEHNLILSSKNWLGVFILTKNNEEYILDDAFMHGGRPALKTRWLDESNRKLVEHIHFLDPSTLQLSDQLTVWETNIPDKKKYQNKGAMDMLRKSSRYAMEFNQTENNSHGAIIELTDILKREGMIEKARIATFDEQAKLIGEIKVPTARLTYSPIFKSIKNNGLMYFMSCPNILLTNMSNFLFKAKVGILDTKTGELEFLEPGSDKSPKGFNIAVTDDDEIIISGLLSSIMDGVTGVFCEKYTSNYELIYSKFHELDTSFISQKLNKNIKAESMNYNRTNNMRYYDYKFNDLVVMANGSYSLVVEQCYEITNITHQSLTNGRTYSSQNASLIHDDIIVINFSKSGDLNWKAVVDKHQSLRQPYSSFLLGTVENEIKLIFNDNEASFSNIDNLNKFEIDKLKSNPSVRITTINEKGEVKNEQLKGAEDFMLSTALCRHIKDQGFLLYSKVDGGIKIGYLEF